MLTYNLFQQNLKKITFSEFLSNIFDINKKVKQIYLINKFKIKEIFCEIKNVWLYGQDFFVNLKLLWQYQWWNYSCLTVFKNIHDS